MDEVGACCSYMNYNGAVLMSLKKKKTKYLNAIVLIRYLLGFIPHTI